MGSEYAAMVPEPVMNPSADAYAGNPASDVVNMELFDRVEFVLHEGAGAAGTATITVEECTAIDGTGATAIAFRYRVKAGDAAWGAWADATASGFTTTAGANYTYQIDVRARALSDGSPFVRLKTTEVADFPVVAGAVACLFGASYQTDPPQRGLA